MPSRSTITGARSRKRGSMWSTKMWGGSTTWSSTEMACTSSRSMVAPIARSLAASAAAHGTGRAGGRDRRQVRRREKSGTGLAHVRDRVHRSVRRVRRREVGEVVDRDGERQLDVEGRVAVHLHAPAGGPHVPVRFELRRAVPGGGEAHDFAAAAAPREDVALRSDRPFAKLAGEDRGRVACRRHLTRAAPTVDGSPGRLRDTAERGSELAEQVLRAVRAV